MQGSSRAAFQEMLYSMPAIDADYFTVLSWGQRFNAYVRWASSPSLLHDLVFPLKSFLELTGEIPEGAGCDAVRALMFYKCREHHFTDSPPREIVDLYRSVRVYVEAMALRGSDAG